MPIAQKIMGQLADVTSLTDLYTVPASTGAVLASIIVCNRTSGPLTFTMKLQPGGTGGDESIIYDEEPVASHRSFIATIGVGLDETDVIQVMGSASGLSFTVSGPEFTSA